MVTRVLKEPNMNKLNQFKSIALASAVLVSPAFLSADHHGEKDIVDTAVAAGSFKTLAAALGAADLVEALKGEGPFTVFAPTDEAFAKLPAGTVESLLKPENKDQLIDILTYHVVAGKVPATKALALSEATALNKKSIKLTKNNEGLYLNKSKVIKTDIECSNGIIHVIDAVLLPPAKKAAALDPSLEHSPRQIVRMAIDRGAPLFNQGNHAACAAVYEMAASVMLTLPEGNLSRSQRKMLTSAMKSVSNTHCDTSNSWTLRRTFDSMLMASAH